MHQWSVCCNNDDKRAFPTPFPCEVGNLPSDRNTVDPELVATPTVGIDEHADRIPTAIGG